METQSAEGAGASSGWFTAHEVKVGISVWFCDSTHTKVPSPNFKPARHFNRCC